MAVSFIVVLMKAGADNRGFPRPALSMPAIKRTFESLSGREGRQVKLRCTKHRLAVAAFA
jgi:hypothetical protein